MKIPKIKGSKTTEPHTYTIITSNAPRIISYYYKIDANVFLMFLHVHEWYIASGHKPRCFFIRFLFFVFISYRFSIPSLIEFSYIYIFLTELIRVHIFHYGIRYICLIEVSLIWKKQNKGNAMKNTLRLPHKQFIDNNSKRVFNRINYALDDLF